MPETASERIGVVVPTRGRPDKLAVCLRALAGARDRTAFTAWVCDSSEGPVRGDVERVCADFPWVVLHHHDRQGIPAARNECVRVADRELLVSIDDDVAVDPGAIDALVRAFDAGSGPRVVGGAVRWPDGWRSAPLVLRPIGYARLAREGEEPEIVNSSLFLYPRSYGLTWPWNERMRRGSDVVMSAVWRGAGVRFLHAPDATAEHDEGEPRQGVQHQDDHLYSILAHALVAAMRPGRALTFEVLGFAASAKVFGRDRRQRREFLTAWARGNRAFARDVRALRRLAARPAPAEP